MKRVFTSVTVCVILISAFLTAVFFMRKTCYLNIENYKYSAYIEVVGEIHLKDYADTNTISDRIAIKRIVQYLNNIPLVRVYGYFDKSKREFIIPELQQNGNDLLTQENKRYGCLIFYNEKGIEKGRIIFHNERYVEGLNYQAYKTRNKEMFIISELETLNLK